MAAAKRAIATSERRIGEIEQDIATRTPTKGDLFAMTVNNTSYTERPKAGGALLNLLRNLDVEQEQGEWTLASIGGFRVSAQAATAEQADAEADDLVGVMPRLRGASCDAELEDEEAEAA